jgi:7-cyano-7-deazaguanine synthase in queuosine biosynthesis
MTAIFLEQPVFAVDVLEARSKPRKGAEPCVIGTNIKFSTKDLESFCFASWDPIIYDMLLVAAAIEFCDRSKSRRAMNWGRHFDLRIPVHDPHRWNEKRVRSSLLSAISFLTGDNWSIEFVARTVAVEPPRQSIMELPLDAEAVISFSEGMDSRAVAGLESLRLGAKLVRVRVGNKDFEITKKERAKQPFTAVPYEVKLSKDNAETSARSRGFKFSTVSAIAAYLVKAQTIIVPESGQGALAPAMIPVGQAYADYRNHPLFTERMEDHFYALLGSHLHYHFPRLWSTKGETLRAFVTTCPEGSSWVDTLSCWQQSRQASVLGKKRQCGICAACSLRRMSVHAAGLDEPASNYVWENLKARNFEDGAHSSFDRKRITRSMREYALAGVLHLDHFASLRTSRQYALLKRRNEKELSICLDEETEDISKKMDGLLENHTNEWAAFVAHLGEDSFINAWIERPS